MLWIFWVKSSTQTQLTVAYSNLIDRVPPWKQHLPFQTWSWSQELFAGTAGTARTDVSYGTQQWCRGQCFMQGECSEFLDKHLIKMMVLWWHCTHLCVILDLSSQKSVSNSLEHVILQKTVLCSHWGTGSDLLDLRENPPWQNVGFVSILISHKLHFSTPKTDISPFSPLLPKVLLTLKVKFEVWEFVLRGGQYLEANLRLKFPRSDILRHCKQSSTVGFCLKISNSSWIMAAHLQKNKTTLILSWARSIRTICEKRTEGRYFNSGWNASYYQCSVLPFILWGFSLRVPGEFNTADSCWAPSPTHRVLSCRKGAALQRNSFVCSLGKKKKPFQSCCTRKMRGWFIILNVKYTHFIVRQLIWEKNRKSGSFSQGKCCEHQSRFGVTVHTGFLTKKHQPCGR